MISLAVAAAVADDGWYKYPVYADDISQVVETSSKVYYLSGGNLFSFSPSDNESYYYSQLNKLNDREIENIYYNPEKKYLVVVYHTGNLDLLFDNGDVINLPDIKDSSVTTSKTINYVAFGDDRIAVATDFGIVIYSDTRYEVIESGIYNKPVTAIGIMDGKLLIYGTATSNMVMFSPVEKRHNNIDKFDVLGSWGIKSFEVIDDTHIWLRDRGDNRLILLDVDFNAHSWKNVSEGEYNIADCMIRRCKDGVYSYSDDKLVYMSSDLKMEVKDIPERAKGARLSIYGTPDKIWTGTSDGIACYDISSDTPTVVYDNMIYDGVTTDKRVGYMKWSADGQRLYISNMENSIYRSYAKGEQSANYQTCNIVEGLSVRDASLKNASAAHKVATEFQDKLGSSRMFGDPTWMVEDPDDPDKYYAGNYFEGLYVIKRNPSTGEYEEIGKFTQDNSSFTDNWGTRVEFVDIDKEGNLWVGHQYGHVFSVLPARKRTQDPSTITASDWKAHPKLEALDYHHKDMQAVLCRHSDMVFYSFAKYGKGFIAIDTKGTYTNLNDDVVMQWDRLTDQDGNDVSYDYITYFLEDNRGCVWVGTNAGVFEISRPAEATDYNMRIRRIKVPRNDGTNYADYLLDSDMINWMALDPAGRKWIATENSGLFLVSETGDEILRQFTSDNSPLPSNSVCTVECDPNDNTVYVGTSYGLYSFKSDASAGQADYSDILAYPNPVRPEYTGVVMISGLKNNSVVKITDAAGNVVYETRSEGGMASWDVAGKGGERVRTGVYYVYASESTTAASTGAVTKILVVN